jgi:uncharacterized membrane protein YjgN (DUF898 family)
LAAVLGRPAGTPESGKVIRPEFTGSAAEYFRIWIVNLFFTVITLGVYSAWAKVRKKRYFYGSTKFDGDSFDYFGSPKAILRGRIVAVAVFIAYVVLGELYPDSKFVFWGLAAVLVPFLAIRALGFNARNSAFRGLRFDFVATPKETAKAYVGRGLLVLVTAGIAVPWFMARLKSFVLSHHLFGRTPFTAEITGRALFDIYLKSGLIIGAFAVPGGFLSAWMAQNVELPEALSWLSFAAGIVPAYIGYAIAFAFSTARTTNLLWSSASAPGMRFESTLSAVKFAKIYVGNLAAIAASAGLLIPWAVIRTMRYRLESFAVIAEPAVVHQASSNLPAVGAMGQEIGDIFNVDIGL